MQALLQAITTMARPADAQRIFHGRGGLYPGSAHWALDVYPPVFVLTSFQPATDEELAAVHAALAQRWQVLAPGEALSWVYQCRHGAGRALTRVMAGSVPEPHTVTEDGVRFRVHVLKGQNLGLFLDMAEGRRWVRSWVKAWAQAPMQMHTQTGLKVLNLFAYTCAFSVVARLAGAQQVVNVDMSAGALATGQQNHALNGLGGGAGNAAGASFLAHDIFNSWGKLTRGGPYGLVVMDPPSYQKGSFVATKDYPRLLRRLPDLLAPGGHALLCLNAPELGMAFLTEHMQAQAPALQFVERVANPAVFADVSPDRSLKVLVYRAPG